MHYLGCRFLQCLLLYQLGVDTTLVNEFTVCTPFGNLAILQDEDMVSILDSRQTMGDGDSRAVLGSGVESGLYNFLGLTMRKSVSVIEKP